MYCSGCGQAIQDGATQCASCGRVVAPPLTPASTIPGFDWQLSNYAGKVKLLAIFWAVYAAYALFEGFLGYGILHMIFGHGQPFVQHDEWSGPFTEQWFQTLMHVIWVAVAMRATLALVAAWGLWTRSGWGRVVAIIAAFFCLLKIPFGTALGIWTLVMLLGYRNSVLYDHLEHDGPPPGI